MTQGQIRAVRELERLKAADPDIFQAAEPKLIEESLEVPISLRLGLMETRSGGLDLREREDFVLFIPPDFPFDRPSLAVTHDRFAGFPHVTWTHWLCLYQSTLEWNPADGLFGFFDRLKLWLGKAAINEMDPVEGALEPPHHIVDSTQLPFLIRSNAPVEAGLPWIGLAELEKHTNRIELVGWNDLSTPWPENRQPALAIFLPKALPMEFPRYGKEFFAELAKQGFQKEDILSRATIAAVLTPENAPAYLLLGVPMRRSSEGVSKHHIAVWSIDPKYATNLREAASSKADSTELASIKNKINDLIYQIFENSTLQWCRVLEERSEIIVRRDAKTPMAWFANKSVLILGCGALGSWSSEIIARANPKQLDFVDNAIVKPGILARQNFTLEEIGSSKAKALAKRTQQLTSGTTVQAFYKEAHSFISDNPDRMQNYDLILDCTASSIFQMKLERDWNQLGSFKANVISFIIDAKARQCLAIVLPPRARGGIWSAFVQLKQEICRDQNQKEIAASFYSEGAAKELFQPEPGCSELTFAGSASDMLNLVSTGLNIAVHQIAVANAPTGVAFSSHKFDGRPGSLKVARLTKSEERVVDKYRVRITPNVYREIKAWVRQNNRVRPSSHETGGLLWGLWDDAVETIWIFDASGPPKDSIHSPGHFVCGSAGTELEHARRTKQSYGNTGFIGFWHTHPDMPSQQSIIDIAGMASLVASVGENQKRALMFIFGREGNTPTAGLYIYESHLIQRKSDFISVGQAQFELETPMV
jgi:hypothetical protein